MVALDQFDVEPVSDRISQQMGPRKGFTWFSTIGLLLGGTSSRRSTNREHTRSTRSIPRPTSTRRSHAR